MDPNTLKELKEFAERVQNTKVIDKNGYKYIILPFDYRADPRDIRILANSMAELIKETIPLDSFDKIVTIESKGILISTILALKLDKPLYIIRKRSYQLDNEKKVVKRTGYEESTIYLNGINENDKVLIVDDLISTGGTLKAVIDTLFKMNCKIPGIFIIFDKIDYGGSKSLKEQYKDLPVKSLIKIHFKEDDKLEVYV